MIVIYDAGSGEVVTREMTEEEIAALPQVKKSTTVPEAPASDDAGAPSTDAG